MKKIISVLICLLFLNGCSPSPQKIKIESKPVEIPKLNLDLPPPILMEDVKWIVITEKNYQEVFEKIRSEQGIVLLISLDEINYKSLATNNTRILRYIREQKSIIAAYRKYYEGTIRKTESADEHRQ